MTILALLLDVAALLATARWFYRRQPPPLRLFYWPALLVKVGAGLCVGWLYFYHYRQGDTLHYWHDGVLVAEKLMADPRAALGFFWADEGQDLISGLINTRPRSLFFVKIGCLAAFLAAGNYWVMASILSCVSFAGAWYLFTKVVHFFPASLRAAAISFLFFPSIVFWSSGLIKESIGLAALFFLAGVFLTLSKQDRVDTWEWAVAAVALWIGWNLKYYWIGVFLPVAVTSVIVNTAVRLRSGFRRFDLALWVGLFLLLIFAATHVHPNFYPSRFLRVIWESNQQFMALTRPENAIHYAGLDGSLSSVLMNAPTALVAGLFRPFVWESHDLFSALAGLENVFLLLLVGTALPALLRLPAAPERVLAFGLICYIVLLATFLALSTPNFGTLSRYKTGFLPFLVFITLYHNPFMQWMKRRLGDFGS